MSDNYTQPDANDDGENPDAESPSQLREAANRSGKWKAEAEAAKRENAFLRAGIDPEDTRMKYFVKGYEGELSADDIKSAAIDAGFMTAPEPPADPAADQAQAGQQRVVAASSGTQTSKDPASVVYGMQQAYKEGGLEGLSAYSRQFGVTFQPEEV
jgi:ribosomal protein L12E/L44/L45/RPP1/RPP2